jgi:ribosomal protein S18 acetylase RimI-like enzyme
MQEQTDTSITFRPATMEDLQQIVAMDQDLFGWYGANEDPEVIRARLQVFPQGCVIAEQPSVERETVDFVGYATTEKWEDFREPALDENPYTTHKPDGRVLNITTLAIGRPYQNQGLGYRLLAHVTDIARREGCHAIVLETARAQNFYLKHGFETVLEREQRGITLYVMRLLLD